MNVEWKEPRLPDFSSLSKILYKKVDMTLKELKVPIMYLTCSKYFQEVE